MESTQVDPRVGLVLNGRYRITEPLGEGGMGLVYRGERVQLRRPVAIKFLHSPYADSAKFVARFQREARAMSMLSHPYCVSVLDFGVHEEPYIVMDFVTGSTLREVLDHERLSPQRALRITRQVLIGLAHAHGQGVIHRDIKPGNIMLGEATGLSDHVRIFDFGLAKLHDPELHGEASMATIVGTPAYMAPEQARADVMDHRADLYSAGVVLFEMLTGRKPFEGETVYQILCLQRDQAPPRLRELAPQLSAELEAVLSTALEKDPAARYQTAPEFAAALEGTPEWAGAEPASSDNPRDRMALAKTQKVSSVQTGSKHEPVRLRIRVREEARSRGRAIAVLLLLGALGFAWWKLHASPWVVRASKAASAVATAVKRAVPAQDSVATEPGGAPATADESGDVEASADAPERDVNAREQDLDRDAEELAELSEAVLAAADEALNDPEEREVALAAPSERPQPPVRSVADVRRLIARGDTDAAIRGLHQLRRKQPRAAQLPFLLGNLYFDKGWWLDGLARYRETIALSSGYRANLRLQRDAIRALGQERAYPRARALLVRDVGRSARAALKRAAHADASTVVRRRASSVLRQLAR